MKSACVICASDYICNAFKFPNLLAAWKLSPYWCLACYRCDRPSMKLSLFDG